MLFRQLFDERLAQYAYLIGCQRTGAAIVVDPERDVDRYLAEAAREGLRLTAVTETHIHADFVSGARELVTRDPEIELSLSACGGEDWSYRWPDADGRAWRPLRHGDSIQVGNVELRALHTPGHTPEHLAFLVVDHGGGADEPMALLSGDFVFVGDLGRPDLLETAAGVVGAREPSARRLFASAREFLELPDWIQVWPGHGAGSACGKALGAVPMSTVGYERRHSPAIAAVGAGESEFVDFILAGQPEPPLYFARMKRWNRDGPPVLGELPRPRRLDESELAARSEAAGSVILDTRNDRAAFYAESIRGSLFAPLNKSFSTIAGSYVGAEEEIVLVSEERLVGEVVRELVRIGFDRIVGWVPPSIFGKLPPEMRQSLPRIRFDESFDAALAEPGARIVDVRPEVEYEARHLDGAIHAAAARLPESIGRLPRGVPLLVHCESGSRASSAAALLAARGFDVRFVDGMLRDRLALATD